MVPNGLRHFQILQHRQTAEDFAFLGNVPHAEPCDAMRGPMGCIVAEYFDRAEPRWRKPDQTSNRGGLAGTVSTQHRDDLAFPHIDRHAVQDMALAIEAMDIVRL
jgi:hypothetical protein